MGEDIEMAEKNKIKKLQEILHDSTKCNAQKFEEIEQIVLQDKDKEEH